MKKFENGLLGVLAALLVVSCASSSHRSAAPAPGWKNLQLIRKDIPREQLIELMRTYSRSLGVRCTYCHEGEQESMDFASDVKSEKRAARVMMQMTRNINEEYISRLESQGNVVDCYTCHRGKAIPEGFLAEAAERQ